MEKKQLIIGIDKYLISSSFYRFLITKTNEIKDYRECKAFVRNAIAKALKGEVEAVKSFPINKIDIEL